MLESLLIFRKQNPDLFHGLDIQNPIMSNLLETGCCVPLIEKDQLDRCVIIINVSKINVTEDSAIDVLRLLILILSYYNEKEDSQVAGFVFIAVGTDVTLKHLTMFSPGLLKRYLVDFAKSYEYK